MGKISFEVIVGKPWRSMTNWSKRTGISRLMCDLKNTYTPQQTKKAQVLVLIKSCVVKHFCLYQKPKKYMIWIYFPLEKIVLPSILSAKINESVHKLKFAKAYPWSWKVLSMVMIWLSLRDRYNPVRKLEKETIFTHFQLMRLNEK